MKLEFPGKKTLHWLLGWHFGCCLEAIPARVVNPAHRRMIGFRSKRLFRTIKSSAPMTSWVGFETWSSGTVVNSESTVFKCQRRYDIINHEQLVPGVCLHFFFHFLLFVALKNISLFFLTLSCLKLNVSSFIKILPSLSHSLSMYNPFLCCHLLLTSLNNRGLLFWFYPLYHLIAFFFSILSTINLSHINVPTLFLRYIYVKIIFLHSLSN